MPGRSSLPECPERSSASSLEQGLLGRLLSESFLEDALWKVSWARSHWRGSLGEGFREDAPRKNSLDKVSLEKSSVEERSRRSLRP